MKCHRLWLWYFGDWKWTKMFTGSGILVIYWSTHNTQTPFRCPSSYHKMLSAIRYCDNATLHPHKFVNWAALGMHQQLMYLQELCPASNTSWIGDKSRPFTLRDGADYINIKKILPGVDGNTQVYLVYILTLRMKIFSSEGSKYTCIFHKTGLCILLSRVFTLHACSSHFVRGISM